MGADGSLFLEWKEEFVSHERGHRVVHYFLKNAAGEFVLAVVGTERSLRHMVYVVAEEFVQAYGAEHSIHTGFKWRSRREVVDWLTSMLAKQHLHGDHSSSSPEHDSANISKPLSRGHLSKNPNGLKSDILWAGRPWTCGKQLKHYPAFSRNGTTIAIQSFVFVMGKGDNPYLAYLEDMYEDKKGQKKVKVRWFHHNREVKGVITLWNHHPKEVFITPHSQVISAECVDGPATILTREHFEKCESAFPRAFLARFHMCCRQFKSSRVKPFDMTKMRGYFDQPIFSCLNAFLKSNLLCHGLADEDEELSPEENVKLGVKRTRDGESYPNFVTDHAMSIRQSQPTAYGPPYRKRLSFLKQVDLSLSYSPLHKIGGKIELLCQDSGLQGCWFRCTVLHLSHKQMRVQYDDILDEEESSNLEEWVPAFKVAAPDKLNFRCLNRPTIRPARPSMDQVEFNLELGAAVDAWWSDGWWEGIITGIDSGVDKLQVYIPGENFSLNIRRKYLRISRDWIGDEWIDIKAKPDILATNSVSISPETKVSSSSNIAKDATLDGFSNSDVELPTETKLDVVQERHSLDALGNSGSLSEDLDLVVVKQPSPLKDEDVGEAINVSQDKGHEVLGNGEDGKADDNDNNEGSLDTEEVETSGQNCKAIEKMELAA